MVLINWLERLPGYHYYDTPEGEDCLQKVIYMNKVGIFFGITAGSLHIIAVSKPVGIAAIAARYATTCYPLMAIGSTFAATTCSLTYMRGVDDGWNYSWGGFAAGCVAGAVFKSGTFGTLAAVTFAAMGASKKHMDELGYDLFGERTQSPKFGGPWALKLDYSLTEERPRGWKMSEDE